MALNLIDEVEIGSEAVVIKFGKTVLVTSLTNNHFIVQTDEATPIQLLNPFKPIVTVEDYQTTSRTLRLYWNTALTPGQVYLLRLVGLQDASHTFLAEEYVVFSLNESATPVVEVIDNLTSIEEISIIDNTIFSDVFSSNVNPVITTGSYFHITETDPFNGDFYLSNDYNDGRVTITFSHDVAGNFLNNRYFKAQRKKIQRGPARWESLAVQISNNTSIPEVYIDFPSLDATPSYNEAGLDYFESGYKYRIIVSKNVGA